MIKQEIVENLIPIKIWTTDIEDEALQQLKNLTNLPGIYKHIAVMPDVHAGKGSTVGTVIASKNMIIPAAVGVDVSCGMKAIQLNWNIDKLESYLELIKANIERNIPVGFAQNQKPLLHVTSRLENFGALHSITDVDKLAKATLQIGTLGGGNHFIEICEDLDKRVWLVCHTGSRNIGKVVADYYINGAEKLMIEKNIELSDKNLAYLTSEDDLYQKYLDDIAWCKRYAYLNRDSILETVIECINHSIYGFNNKELWDIRGIAEIHCNHNFVQEEIHFGEKMLITRKGAVSASKGEYGIIPGSMGAKSFIVRGLGNEDSFASCSHGAGRKMSRTKAKKQFTVDDLLLQTNGVLCRKDSKVIDEIPAAYKNIDEVMENQKDLVEIVTQLKQRICIKG